MKRIEIHNLLKLLLPLLLMFGSKQCCADTVSITFRYYHGDHLGSASWITNGNGTPVQHLQYMPYGEPFVNERTSSSSYEERYTFTGKERDSETGYSYFGARFYDSDLMTGWLSVDPMADKYPGLSPYAYCAWNPVKLVDPDGKDVWEIDAYGYITKYEKTTEFDKFVVINKNGSTAEKTFDYGTITDWIKPSIRSNGIDYKSDMFRVNGDNKAQELFEFFANNTLVEWTHAKIGSEDSEKNIVGTIHQTSKTNIGGYLRETNYTLREVNHNHPAGFPPSETDLLSAKSYIEKFPNIKLNVYTKEDKYIPYDAEQYYKSSINLPEAYIFDKKITK